MSDEQHHVAPEGAQRLDAASVNQGAWRVVWANDAINRIAARYEAARQDRIAAYVDAAEHDPGTPEAWADGCECERQQSRTEFDVTWGCPMHDPREA